MASVHSLITPGICFDYDGRTPLIVKKLMDMASILGLVWSRRPAFSSNIFDRQVLDVETEVVSRLGFFQFFVVHFDGFDFSGSTPTARASIACFLV